MASATLSEDMGRSSHESKCVSIDASHCERLAALAAEGDAKAREQLIEHLWPHWLRLARAHRRLAPLPDAEELAHEVATTLAAKLGRTDSHHLRLYPTWQATHPEKDFADWIRILTANAARDMARSVLGRRKPEPGAAPSVKAVLNELSGSLSVSTLGSRPPMTNAQTARQLLEHAERRLSASRYGALRSWLMGSTFEEIGAEAGMAPEAARREVRAAVAVLRRHFAPEG